MLKLHFPGIGDPEALEEEAWLLNKMQLQWLMENNQIPGMNFESA